MTQCRDFLLACVRDNPRLTGAIVAFNTRCPEVPVNAANPAGLTDPANPANPALPEHPASTVIPIPCGVRPEAAPLLPLFARDAGPGSRMAGRAHLLYADAAAPDSVPPTWWALDFRVVRHRLALLDRDTLTRLARWCGLLRHKAEIARMIDRESVLALRAEVGEEGHRFVLRRSALLPGARDLEAAPEGRGPIGVRLRASGYAMIASCLADAPKATTAMLLRTAPGMFADALRAAVPYPAPAPDFAPASAPVPASVFAPAPAPALAGAPSPPVSVPAGHDPSRYWPLVRTLLFKEIAPAWEPCFT